MGKVTLYKFYLRNRIYSISWFMATQALDISLKVTLSFIRYHGAVSISYRNCEIVFMHYSCVVINLFHADLYKSVYPIYYSKNIFFRLSVFWSFRLFCFELDVIFIYSLINVYVTKCTVIFFSLYINFIQKQKNRVRKNFIQESFWVFKKHFIHKQSRVSKIKSNTNNFELFILVLALYSYCGDKK